MQEPQELSSAEQAVRNACLDQCRETEARYRTKMEAISTVGGTDADEDDKDADDEEDDDDDDEGAAN